jgi:hypothetical protein
VSRNAGSQTRSFSSLMYRKACSTSARSTPGERPGGRWGLSGSLTYTSAPLASSILPTQLVAVRGIPVTRMGPPRAVAHLRALASSMTLAAMWGGSSS